MQGVAL
jgi:hypothetical protein